MNTWLIDLVREAGRIALDYRVKGFDVTIKPDQSPVTSADLAIDGYFHEMIGNRFPDDTILSEESPDPANRLEAHRTWIIDPIDGTSHYVAGKDDFGVLVALCEDGEAVESVASFPGLDLMLYGKRGGGAFVNGRPVKVSGIDSAPKIATKPGRFDNLKTAPWHVLNNALEIFHVIGGDLEGVVTETSVGTGEHDYAWAVCPIEEAGGRITDVAGNPLRFNKPVRKMPPVIVCTNGLVHESLLERVRKIEGSA